MLRKESRKEENFEKLIACVPEEIREEHMHEILTDGQLLKYVPIEMKKKEANKAIYLTRYE